MTMSKSLNVRKGDKVRIIAGKDKGKEGTILAAQPERERVLIEGINFAKKHQRPTQRNPKGGIVEREAPIHVSNVMLICPNCSQPTRVGRRREDGIRVRVCKKCGRPVEK
jgi:large subunit ribosomal protein L24